VNWESLTAISSAVTAAVIGATAIIAMVQIRHLRKAAQLESFLQLMSEATGPQMAIWASYVETTLPERLKDETYRRELAEGCYDAEHHKELALGAFWEKIGTLVHFGLIEPEAFVDFAAAICPHHWHLLRDVVALRRTENVHIWERFEEFAALCEANLPPRQPQGV